MTKSEKAEMERLRRDLERAKALKWPDAPEPRPMERGEIEQRLADETDLLRVPGRYGGHALRVVFINDYTGTMCDGLVDRVHHKTHSTDPSDGGWSQSQGRPYRSRQEAALALRWALCRKFADQLIALSRE